MRKEIHDVIQKIYIEKNYDYYREKAAQPFEFTKEVEGIFDAFGTNYVKEKEVSDDTDDPYYPYVHWYLKYDSFAEEKFMITYVTYVRISKIAKIVYVNHYFSVENQVPRANQIGTDLSGWFQYPHTIQQFNLEKTLKNFLEEKGYIFITCEKMEEVAEDVEVPPMIRGPKDLILYTPGTVRALLFNDEFELLAPYGNGRPKVEGSYDYVEEIKDIVSDLVKRFEERNTMMDLAAYVKSSAQKIFSAYGKCTYAVEDKYVVFTVTYPSVYRGNFHVEFWTRIRIPKGIKAYDMCSYFAVKNQDPNGLADVLTGKEDTYTMAQYLLEKAWGNYMFKKKYTGIFEDEKCLLVEGKRNADGTLMTVEMLIFGTHTTY